MSIDPNVPKSCATCPSFLESRETVGRFKKSIGVPLCGRYGNVLGRAGATPVQIQQLQQFTASQCDAYGELPTPLPRDHRFQVALPDPTTRTNAAAPDVNCTSCQTCVNYVNEIKVSDELGWASGMCAAKGKLILSGRGNIEARGCEFRVRGVNRASTDGIHLLPEFEDAFSFVTDPIKAFLKGIGKPIEDPTAHPTDQPVSEEQIKEGIMAWRKINDPVGSGRFVMLPIYNPTFFSPEEFVKIPKSGDDEHPEMYVDHEGAVYKLAVLWRELDETPALWGMAGVGKTELYRHMAWLMSLPFERMSITASTELDDLFGKMHYSPDKGTYFTYGRLPLAWGKPCVICLDEPNTGPPDVWQAIRPLTDNSKQLVLDMNNGERHARHDHCYMGLAMNPAWDPKNVGTGQIGDADGSRLMHIEMGMPPELIEREIIKARVRLDGWELDDARLDAIMKIAVDIRAMVEDDTLPITWGVRPQIKVGRAVRWFDLVTAYRMASADFLEPEARDQILDIVKSHAEGQS